MSDTNDGWPGYYGASYAKHLHALGVIAITFANFQAAMDDLYLKYATRAGVPREFSALYYFSLSEEKHNTAIKDIVSKYEKDAIFVDLILNLLDHFKWCQHCRNNLLHAEQYPAGIVAVPGTLYLTKKASKSSSKSGYIKLTLPQARYIADNIRAGVVQSAHLRKYFRYRDESRNLLHKKYHAYAYTLPEKLHVPDPLRLALTP
jgi:hypothetical protein